MNCKDIEAARRLIAQFNDRADGRHNSSHLADIRKTQVATPAPEYRATPPVHASRPLMSRLDVPLEHLTPEERSVRELVERAHRRRVEEGRAFNYAEAAERLRANNPWLLAERVPINVAQYREHWEQCNVGDYVLELPGLAHQDPLRVVQVPYLGVRWYFEQRTIMLVEGEIDNNLRSTQRTAWRRVKQQYL